jgi:hypothetical protein
MPKIIFDSKEDCDHFVSIKADHWWWLSSSLYGGKRLGSLEVKVNNNFKPVFHNPQNKEPMHRGLQGKIRWEDDDEPDSAVLAPICHACGSIRA